MTSGFPLQPINRWYARVRYLELPLEVMLTRGIEVLSVTGIPTNGLVPKKYSKPFLIPSPSGSALQPLIEGLPRWLRLKYDICHCANVNAGRTTTEAVSTTTPAPAPPLPRSWNCNVVVGVFAIKLKR